MTQIEKSLVEAAGDGGMIGSVSDEREVMEFLIKNIEMGKTYYVAVGGHAACVQKTSYSSLNYLELQGEKASENGWKYLEEWDVDNRFKYEKGSSEDIFLIESKSLASSPGFRDTMSYINTRKTNNKKEEGSKK